jgi:hypothetical protein
MNGGEAMTKIIAMKKFVIILLFTITIGLPFAAHARDFDFKAGDDDKLCVMIEEILNDPINEDYTDWSGAWAENASLRTSRFKLPEKFKDKIKWVEWETVPNENVDDYFVGKHVPEDVKGRGSALTGFPVVLSKAEIQMNSSFVDLSEWWLLKKSGDYSPFAISGDEKPFLLFQTKDISDWRHALPDCYMPNKNLDTRLDEKFYDYDAVHGSGVPNRPQGSNVNYPIESCALFYYEDVLYNAEHRRRGITNATSINIFGYDPVRKSVGTIISRCSIIKNYKE